MQIPPKAGMTKFDKIIFKMIRYKVFSKRLLGDFLSYAVKFNSGCNYIRYFYLVTKKYFLVD